MTLLLLTSRYEGLLIVFLEAMLQGVPVVSTRVGGVSECVTEEVGLLVDAGASASSISVQVSICLIEFKVILKFEPDAEPEFRRVSLSLGCNLRTLGNLRNSVLEKIDCVVW
jgi:glycosyltransferase involved in cell wall biosynthesis